MGSSRISILWAMVSSQSENWNGYVKNRELLMILQRVEEPKNLRDAWKQKHEVLLLMNVVCDNDLSRTSRTSMLKNNEWRQRRSCTKTERNVRCEPEPKKYYVRKKTGTYCMSTDWSTLPLPTWWLENCSIRTSVTHSKWKCGRSFKFWRIDRHGSSPTEEKNEN